MGDHELDVRGMRKPDKHPAIFQAYKDLGAGESLLLINDHDPKHLRDEFEIEYPRGFSWTYVSEETRDWRIRITKLAETALPRVLADTTVTGVASDGEEDPAGVVWKLQMRERDLDSNIIVLAPGGEIGAHAGPDIDVMICVLSGSGQITTERDTLDLAAGSLAWLPRRSRRAFAAGPQGLRYLTVHLRRKALALITPSGVEAV